MGIKYRRPDIAVPQQFLYGSDIIVGLEQMTGKTAFKSLYIGNQLAFVDFKLSFLFDIILLLVIDTALLSSRIVSSP